MPYPTILGRRDWPCCPGTKLRFSMAHFSVKHRRPFRNNFCPSRRHRRQTASRCLANFDSPLATQNLLLRNSFQTGKACRAPSASPQGDPEKSDAAALWRTAAVVRDRRYVADDDDVQARGGESSHGGFAAGAGTLYANLDALHAVLIARDTRGGKRGLLRSVGRALTRTLEADRARRGPAHCAAIGIGDRDLRVVERRGDVHQAVRNGAALTLFLEFLLALARCRRGRFSRCSSVGCCVCRFLCHFVLRFSNCFKTSKNLRLTSCQAGAQQCRAPK